MKISYIRNGRSCADLKRCAKVVSETVKTPSEHEADSVCVAWTQVAESAGGAPAAKQKSLSQSRDVPFILLPHSCTGAQKKPKRLWCFQRPSVCAGHGQDGHASHGEAKRCSKLWQAGSKWMQFDRGASRGLQPQRPRGAFFVHCRCFQSIFMRHVPLVVVQFPFHTLESCLPLFLRQQFTQPQSVACHSDRLPQCWYLTPSPPALFSRFKHCHPRLSASGAQLSWKPPDSSARRHWQIG